ncbi:membrane-spanning 4-domains subfamily A member 4A-like [Vombatus ursinus]|uniref:membrane-spanning 4-domains subfamily A member 4A-like n=1 Tax=Vombatus ursinus TaxID=29139 RepID=UPI000FFDA813|nr:membrane-spanning 4-domains subfamily A member 4A-like [Vombatus ursinus]
MESQAATKGTFPSFPQTGPIAIPQESIVQSYQLKEPLQKFLRGKPKVLGTVQIIIALMNFGLGMIVAFFPWNFYGPGNFLWPSGYIFWGSAFFIISGSLSIAAENRTTYPLIQSSLAMNIVSSVVAGLGIIFFSFNLVMFAYSHYYYCRQEGYHDVCVFGHSLLLGSNGFLLILNVLEFAVSLGVSAFGCNAICCLHSGFVIFMPPSTHVPENSAAEACKEGTTLQSPVADPTALPGSHPDSFI